MENWKPYRLGEITKWLSGGTPKKSKSEFWNGDIPWISANSMHTVRIKDSDLKITNLGLTNGSKIAPKNSILLLVRGGALHSRIPLGIVMRDVAFNQDVKAIIANEKIINPWFLLAWFISNTDFLLKSVEFTGIGAGKFDTTRLQNLIVNLPSLKEQGKIANFAKAIDDKIEINQQMNATLAAMARTLFKAWFVDFEPVRANSENRPSESASPEIAKLFPSEFEDEIPKGWQFGTIADLGRVICGKTPSTKIADNFGIDIPFITIPDMHGKVFVTRTARYLSNKGANTQANKYLPANSICVSCIATAGIVTLSSEISQTNQQINSVIPSDDFGTFYSYQVLNKLGQEIRTKGSGGSVFVNLNTGSFSRISVLLPQKICVKAYNDLVIPAFEKILNNEKENQKLAEIRDSLLPRLISGKIRVGEMEIK